jgi:hypothetical protein
MVHQAGSFVITMPNAYHSGFNTGFNVAEAVNFAPANWLPHGSDAVAKYRSQGKPVSLSHDQVLVTLVGAAGAVAVAHGVGGGDEQLDAEVAEEVGGGGGEGAGVERGGLGGGEGGGGGAEASGCGDGGRRCVVGTEKEGGEGWGRGALSWR